ncbi:hypothetical protein G6F56_011583 [Rhizopus delemar]|nr:hypothetical protein G6F56_011583 [Rhizopus delemar]
MLINGGSKYNRKRRKHNNKKKKRGRKKKKKAPNQAGSTTGSALNTNRQSRWRPLEYEESPKKVPLIIFGDGMFGKNVVKLKNNRTGVTGVFWRSLKKREREGGLIAITIDEYKTSKICNKCRSESLEAASHTRGQGVLECKTCSTLWQRDVNTTKKMLSIGVDI